MSIKDQYSRLDTWQKVVAITVGAIVIVTSCSAALGLEISSPVSKVEFEKHEQDSRLDIEALQWRSQEHYFENKLKNLEMLHRIQEQDQYYRKKEERQIRREIHQYESESGSIPQSIIEDQEDAKAAVEKLKRAIESTESEIKETRKQLNSIKMHKSMPKK